MMRFYSVLLLFIFTGLAAAQEINWMSMEAALAKQKEVPKKIMVDMYTTWCGPCRMLDKNTFSNKKLAAYVNANYYACLLYTSPSPRDGLLSRMPSSA